MSAARGKPLRLIFQRGLPRRRNRPRSAGGTASRERNVVHDREVVETQQQEAQTVHVRVRIRQLGERVGGGKLYRLVLVLNGKIIRGIRGEVVGRAENPRAKARAY